MARTEDGDSIEDVLAAIQGAERQRAARQSSAAALTGALRGARLQSADGRAHCDFIAGRSGPMRDAFGRLIGSPELLDLPGRVDCLRRLAGELQAGKSAESRWLGRSLATWLQRGGNLADRLGVKASRGSHRTPQAMVAQDARDDGLLRLSVGLPAATGRLRQSCVAPGPARVTVKNCSRTCDG